MRESILICNSALMEEVVKVEMKIDERVKGLYGL